MGKTLYNLLSDWHTVVTLSFLECCYVGSIQYSCMLDGHVVISFDSFPLISVEQHKDQTHRNITQACMVIRVRQIFEIHF